jgi:hypothetical protein
MGECSYGMPVKNTTLNVYETGHYSSAINSFSKLNLNFCVIFLFFPLSSLSCFLSVSFCLPFLLRIWPGLVQLTIVARIVRM